MPKTTKEKFEILKASAIELWKEISDYHTYLDEKIGSIQDLYESGDNAQYIINMFDFRNQKKLFDKVGSEIMVVIFTEEEGWPYYTFNY